MEASDAFYSQHQSLYGVDHLLEEEAVMCLQSDY